MPTNKKIKIFISQQMHGRDEKEIEEERTAAIKVFMNFAIANKWMSTADTIVDVNWMYDEPAPVPNANRIWYLGRSIQKLSEADYVVFVDGWGSAKGCHVEYEAAKRYFSYSVNIHDRQELPSYDGETREWTSLSPITQIWFGRNA